MSTNRRLSDKILLAFDQACDQRNAAVGELLIRALELALTAEGGPGKTDGREELGPVVEAYARLKAIQNA